MSKSNIDVWLDRETPNVRKALETASKYFDGSDTLTVNTLEAIYARESSFGLASMLGKPGDAGAAGHFRLKAETAKRYGLRVSATNDERFDINKASVAAAQHLKKLDTMFTNNTVLMKGLGTIGVKNSEERKKFVLGAYAAGEGNVAKAQRYAEKMGEDPQQWSGVVKLFDAAGISKLIIAEVRQYFDKVPSYEIEFSKKSSADKNKKSKYRCTEGHWRTIDGRRVFICD